MTEKTESGISTAPNWAQVLYLRIYKSDVNQQHSDAYVFANLRQQCRIIVKYVVADSDGNPVLPTQGSLSLGLIDATHKSDLTTLPDWTVLKEPGAYEWNESVVQRMAGSTSANDSAGTSSEVPGQLAAYENVVEFFVATSTSVTTTIGARIEMPGTSLRVDSLSQEIGDDNGGLGDGHGKFHSTVRIHAVSATLPQSCYGDLNPGSNSLLAAHYIEGGSTRVFEHIINVRYPGTDTEVNLNEFKIPSGASLFCLWEDRGEADGGQEWAFTYSVQPGSSNLQLNDDRPRFIGKGNNGDGTMWDCFRDHVKSVVHRSQARIIIGVVLGYNHYQFFYQLSESSFERSDARLNNTITFSDAYGNEHRLRVTLENIYQVHIYKA